MVKFCKSRKCVVGKTVIITGCNTGIGYETALELAKRGGRIIMACRNLEKAKVARDKIVSATGNENVIVKQIDLDFLSSVRKFAEDIIETEDRLDVLINNAGAFSSADKLTEDNLLVEMQINYFSPFLLTILLLDLLKKSAPSRIINVSSSAAKYGEGLKLDKLNRHTGDVNVYSRTKLCQIYFTQELGKKLEGTGVTTYSVHPGPVSTEILRNSKFYSWVARSFFRTPVEGAQTMLYATLEDGIEKYNGEHFEDCEKVKPYNCAKSDEKRKKLWEMSEELVGLSQK